MVILTDESWAGAMRRRQRAFLGREAIVFGMAIVQDARVRRGCRERGHGATAVAASRSPIDWAYRRLHRSEEARIDA